MTTTPAGYSGTPLPRKLGLKRGMRIRLIDPPLDYWEIVGIDPAAEGITELAGRGRAEADFTHFFASTHESLGTAFTRARGAMTVDGSVWASWPKRSSGLASEIGQADVMAAGKAAGLVDVKVCAFDETWSGLKFVIPLKDRRR